MFNCVVSPSIESTWTPQLTCTVLLIVREVTVPLGKSAGRMRQNAIDIFEGQSFGKAPHQGGIAPSIGVFRQSSYHAAQPTLRPPCPATWATPLNKLSRRPCRVSWVGGQRLRLARKTKIGGVYWPGPSC